MLSSDSKIVISAVGSGGDVFPFIEIADALQERGFDVCVFGPARYEFRALERKVKYRPIGSDDVFAEIFDGDDIWTSNKGAAAAWRYYTSAMQTGFELIANQFSPKSTLLISSTFSLSSRLLQEVRGFKNINVHLSPSVIFSYKQPPVWPEKSIPPGWPTFLKSSIAWAAEKFGLDPVIAPMVNSVRATHGLKPVHRVFSQWIHSPDGAIYAFPRWFAEPAQDWPVNGVFSDFPISNYANRSLSESVDEFLGDEKGQEVVLVTPGTAVKGENAWVHRVVEGALDCGFKVLYVSTGKGLSAPRKRVLHVPFVPFEQALRRVTGVVHHGGIGTIAEALRSGVPQVIVPTAHDQFDNASRVQHLGLGKSATVETTVSEFSSLFRSTFVRDGRSRFYNSDLTAGIPYRGGIELIADFILSKKL